MERPGELSRPFWSCPVVNIVASIRLSSRQDIAGCIHQLDPGGKGVLHDLSGRPALVPETVTWLAPAWVSGQHGLCVLPEKGCQLSGEASEPFLADPECGIAHAEVGHRTEGKSKGKQ